MPADLLLALIAFAFVSSITPGPNNLMLLASGVNFGFRPTIPHLLGISIGHSVMVVLVGLGFGEIFRLFPPAYTALKIAGVAYMLWLAWRVANAGPVKEVSVGGSPMTFLGAAAFQWVNPKAWVMAVTACAAYTVSENYFVSLMVVAGVFAMTNLPSVSVWAMFGTAMRRVLGDPRRVRVFNIAMALLLAASVVPTALELVSGL